MHILICNAGSTSLKFKLYAYPGAEVLAVGRQERIGSRDFSSYSFHIPGGETYREERCATLTYESGIKRFLKDLERQPNMGRIDAVGFKATIAKGYPGVHIIDEDVIRGMEEELAIAPVHNRVYIDAIRAFQKVMPEAVLVSSFETGFHQTLPKHRRIYSVPYEWYTDYGVERKGYHGASHAYVAEKLSGYRRVISCHLGGSGSVCAIMEGKSTDTSFGLSLQAGLTHVNRCGDIDPFIMPYLLRKGVPYEEILKGLNENGGLGGISGLSGDMRDLQEAAAKGSERARLAIDIYTTDVTRYIGAFAAEMGGIDALAFTAGIGENSPEIREAILKPLAFMGLNLDSEANARNETRIESGPVPIYVIPADEERVVSQKVYELLSE